MALQKTSTAIDEVLDHMRVMRGEQPYVHNHYTDDRFWQVDRGAGTVSDIYDKPVLRVPEEFLIGVSKGLLEEVGERSAGECMYACGRRWGVRELDGFVPRVEREFECEYSKMSMGTLLETWWWPFAIGGWGSWNYDFSQGKQGLIFVDLEDSAVAKSLGNVGQVVCHFYAGLFASAFSKLSKRELGAIEVQCYSMGDDFCKFLIASTKRVDAAQFWQNEGATYNDIIKKIENESE